jgi:hypothetical protein
MRPRGQVTAGVAGLGIAALDLFRCKDFLYAEVVSSPQGNFIAGWKRPLRWHCFLALVTRPPVDLVCSVNNVLGLFGEVPEDVDWTCPNFLFINKGDPESGATTIVTGGMPNVIHEEIQEAGWRGIPDENRVIHFGEIVPDHGDLVEQQFRAIPEQIAYTFPKALFLRRPYARMRDGCTEKHPVFFQVPATDVTNTPINEKTSALTGTDPLSLMNADPADAREFVIGYAGKQSLVRRRAASALR